MLEFPRRPPASSRGMLIVCAVLFMALVGILLFLNRARGQAPSASPAASTSMTTPSSNDQTATKPSADELKKKLSPEQYRADVGKWPLLRKSLELKSISPYGRIAERQSG